MRAPIARRCGKAKARQARARQLFPPNNPASNKKRSGSDRCWERSNALSVTQLYQNITRITDDALDDRDHLAGTVASGLLRLSCRGRAYPHPSGYRGDRGDLAAYRWPQGLTRAAIVRVDLEKGSSRSGRPFFFRRFRSDRRFDRARRGVGIFGFGDGASDHQHRRAF